MPTSHSTLTILEIPLSKICPNPDNPRGAVDPLEAQAMAESLKEEGQKTTLKVRLLTEAEKAQWAPCEYMVIGGHVRLEGAKLAGLPFLRAEVVEGSNPDQEFLDAALDNRWSDMGWWKWDLVIERLLKPTKGKGQNKVAAQLEFSTAKVNNAWKITQALTPTARGWVDQNIQPLNAKNKGFLITESILLALADLEDPSLVEKALRRVLDGHLSEAEAKKLVEWIKGGGQPEEFPLRHLPAPKLREAGGFGGQVGQTSPSSRPSPRMVSSAEPIKGEGDTPQKPSSLEAKTQREGISNSAGPAASSATPQDPQEGSSFGSWLGGAVLAKQFTKKFGVLGPFLNRYLPHLPRMFNWTKGWVHKAGVKNHTAAWLITVFILLWVGTTAIHIANRVVSRVLVHMAYMRLSPPRLARGTNTGSASAPAQPDQDQLDVDSQRALNFAKDFYTPDYHDTDTWMQFMSYVLAPDYSDAFFKAFCPPERIEDIRNRKLKGEFHSNQPVKFLGMDSSPSTNSTNSPGSSGQGDEIFLVQGMASVTSDSTQAGQVLAQGPVALEVHVRPAPESKDVRINGVVERTALNVPTGSESQTASKAIKPVASKKTAGKKIRKARAVVQAAPVGNPKTIPSWAQDEIPGAGDFASRFYGVSYSNWNDTLSYLKSRVLPDYAPALVAQYFPASLLDQMQKQQLAEYFSSTQPPRVLRGQGDSAEIWVQGTVTTQTRLGRTPQTLSTKPAALLIRFKHADGIGSKIDKVEEVDPHLSTGPQVSGQGLVVPSQGADVNGGTKLGSAKTSPSPNGDLGKSIEGTVHDVGHAVNTTQEGTDAVDKAKKLLGF